MLGPGRDRRPEVNLNYRKMIEDIPFLTTLFAFSLRVFPCVADESILERLADFGYPREAVVQCLNKNELNNATTAYWLIQMALQM